jgi:phage shock protein C
LKIKGEKKMGEKRLYRSNNNKVLLGICGGIGEYLNVDPVVIRLLWVIFCCMGGSGVLAYIIAAIIIPYQP